MERKKGGIPEVFITEKQKEYRRINSVKPARSKYIQAARAHRGEVWVKDPMLLL